MSKITAILLLAVSSLFFNLNAKAQNIILTTQAQVDAFNQTSTPGNLFIGPGNITNVDGLSELTTIGGNLFINSTGLTNVDGLSNLTSIADRNLFITLNQSLLNLDGLSGVTSLSTLHITNNNALLNLDGLSNLTAVTLEIIIESNDDLLNIDGLSGITGTNTIEIVDNDALTSIVGLSTFVNIGILLLIEGNNALTNVTGLSGLVSPLADINISDNDLLANVNGLSNLKIAKGDLIIQYNPVLASLGLTSLESVEGNFIIQGNTHLTSIAGLSKLKSVTGNLEINVNSFILGGDGGGLPNLSGLENLLTIGGNLEVINNIDLVDFCGLYNLFHAGTIGGTIEIVRNEANTVALTPPDAVTVNADQGLCSAALTEATIGTATPVGCLESFTVTHTDFPAANVFPVGVTQITWYVTDGAGNTASALQTITVIDNQPPTITCPANINISCASDVPAVNINSVTASDNCSAVVTHVSDVITNQTCTNRFTLTRTYRATDGAGNTAECSQVITVNDNVAPQLTGLSPSQTILWPPNHKMQDITLSYTAIDNCAANLNPSVTITSNEPDNGTGDGDTDDDWEIIDDHHIRLRAERAANGTGRIYTITVTINDGCNPSVSATTEVRVTHNITAPNSGKAFIAGSSVSFSGEFWDKPGNRHTAKWLIDGSTTAKASVTEPSGNKNGKVTGSYKFSSPGVYKLQMNTTDQNGVTTYANTSGDVDAIVVIYDPNGGYTYGGGYFNSPAGALTSDQSATGKASYGFAMNYFKNSTNPKGETQFEFKVGDFEFNALNFDYLVINNSMAQFKGTGKIIGGQSGVGFTMTITDGALDGTGVDKIRMKIYNKTTGAVIYDNQPGASDAALPIQAVGANSTIVISGTNSSITSANTNQRAEMEAGIAEISNGLVVIAFPNPSTTNFTINVKSNLTDEKITIQVFDMYGRIIETKNINTNSAIHFGNSYRPGTYFIKIIQGKEHKEIKLVKLSD